MHKLRAKPIFSRALVPLACFAAVTVTSRAAFANSTYVNTFAVNDYGGGGNDLGSSISDMNKFYNNLVNASGSIWAGGYQVFNQQVSDRYFFDPDARPSPPAGSADGASSFGFDQSGFPGIMAFQGHGRCGGPTITCSNGNQSVVGGNCVRGCTSAFDCGFNSPPGTYPEAACVAFPQYKTGGQRSSACVWGTDRYLVTNSSLDINGGSVVITGSQASPTGRDFMRLGESVSSGTWAGAGTDGGANMALFLASCATFPGLEFTLRASMAGVHQINTVSVHYTGDWADSPDMASIFGAYYAAHPSSMVKDAWSYVVAHTTTGSGCGSKYDTGMAHGGFNGCGSLVTFATGADTAEARTHLNETWSTLQVNNKQDAQANNAVALMRTCNYDCVKYPPTL